MSTAGLECSAGDERWAPCDGKPCPNNSFMGGSVAGSYSWMASRSARDAVRSTDSTSVPFTSERIRLNRSRAL